MIGFDHHSRVVNQRHRPRRVPRCNREASERRAVPRSDLTCCARDAWREKVLVRAAAVDYPEWSVDSLWSDRFRGPPKQVDADREIMLKRRVLISVLAAGL